MGTFTSRLVEDAVWRCLDGCIRRLEAPLRADARGEQSQIARLLDRLIARVECWDTLAQQQRDAVRAAQVPFTVVISFRLCPFLHSKSATMGLTCTSNINCRTWGHP